MTPKDLSNDTQQLSNKKFVEGLRDKISELEITVESKDAENYLLQSEMQDTLSPATTIMKLNQIVLGMICELNEFIRLKARSKKTDDSMARLAKIIELVACMDAISTSNYTLKCSNKYLMGVIGRYRLENQELKTKLNNILKAENF